MTNNLLLHHFMDLAREKFSRLHSFGLSPVSKTTRVLSFLITGFFLAFSQNAFAQVGYTITGPTPGNLLRTIADNSTTGATNIHAFNAGGAGNTWSAAQTLPFAFNFFGTPVTSYVVNKNGLLSFDAALAATTSAANLDVNTALPNANLPANTIAYFWGDFASPVTGDNIWAVTYGTAPNRQHWVFTFSYTLDVNTFTYNAVVLEETSNKVYVVDMYNNPGGTYTVGVQKDATTAYQVAGSPNIALVNTGTANSDNDYYTFEPFTLAANELGILDITAPANGCGLTATETVSVVIKNFGTAAQTNFPVRFAVTGPTNTAQITETVTTSIPAGGTITYTFTGKANLASVGNYSITASTALTGDANPANDARTESIASYNALTGTYTINAANPTSATNFASFSDMATALNTCGVTGPVTINVAASSGPYTEQIVLMQITGTSATNTITINGNGRTLQADPQETTPAVITLDGTDRLTINNLTIATTGVATTSFGWGIHLLNGADNNTINGNTINIGSLSTSAINSGGIIFSNSATAATTVGNTGNNNVISGNTINGGYRGIRLNSVATTASNNQITGNTIKDFYSAGIEIDDANGTLVDGNNISRPGRAVVTTFEGITLSGTTQNTIVSKNRIHNSHGGATTITGTAYGLYSTANDAPVGSENIFRNNLVYNFNNTGTVYGIHNSSSNGVFYYHNTIDLTNPNNTGTVRGMYQTTLASNIKVINNIFTVNAGTTGVKTALYFNTATSTITSNNNVLYVDPTATNQHIGYWSGSDRTTLANFQAANATSPFDLNSVAVDPIYVNPAAGNFQPTNGAVNNIGQALVAVTTDITGATRNPTAPDPGAYEFSPAALDLGLGVLVTPATQNCYSNAEPVTVTVTNFGASPIDFSTVTATATVNVTGAATPAPLTVTLTNAFNGGQPLAPAASMNVLVGTVNMSAAGTYTFNGTSAITAGGTDGNAANNALTATNITVSPLAAGTASATNTQLCQSGVSTLNLTGNTGGDVQWQSATAAAGPFTNITGATGNSFTLTTPITQTTYYRAVNTCGTNNVNSNVVTVTVSNPTAPTVAAVSRCGAGPVTLTTTAPTGATVNWYTDATGGSAVATGPTYSPNVTATTTFYASITEGGATENVGRVTGGTSTFISAATGWGLHFVANAAVTINSVNVYAVGTGTITIKITDPTDNVLYTAQPVTITGATTAQKLLIPVNLAIPAGTYKMTMSYTGITALVRESSGSTYPYTSPSGAVSITAGSTGAGSATSSAAYYWFYDWTITTGCESSRTAVVATVNPTPATPTVTSNGVVLTSSATTGNQWYLNGTLIPGATGQTHTPTAFGTYTVVSTVNSCASAASTGVAIGLGVNKALAGMSVEVYPNPASGSFNVKLNGYQKDAAVVLYSLTGQMIATDKVSADGKAKNMDIKGLAAGTYMLKVTSDKGVQVTRLVVQ